MRRVIQMMPLHLNSHTPQEKMVRQRTCVLVVRHANQSQKMKPCTVEYSIGNVIFELTFKSWLELFHCPPRNSIDFFKVYFDEWSVRRICKNGIYEIVRGAA